MFYNVKIKKILKILCILSIVCLILPIMSNANNFKSSTDFEGTTTTTDIDTVAENILSSSIAIIRIVGYGIATTILIVIACKYMVSAPGDRADLKKNAVPFVIGAVVLFGASGILQIIGYLAENVSSEK